MARYLLLWEVDSGLMPEDFEERKARHQGFQQAVKQQLADGQIAEWGAFVGEMNGYCIIDGSAADVHKLVARWVPAVSFETRQVLSIEQVIKATDEM